MSSAVLRAEGTKNKRPRHEAEKDNGRIMFGRMIIKKSEVLPNNVRTTFYDPNDIPKIEVNSQLDNRALNEYKKGVFEREEELTLPKEVPFDESHSEVKVKALTR